MVCVSTTFQAPGTAGETVGRVVASPSATDSGAEKVRVIARAGVIVPPGAGRTVAERPRPSGNQVTRIAADSLSHGREAACTWARPNVVLPTLNGSETTLRGVFRVRQMRSWPRLTTTTRTGVEKCTCTGAPGWPPSHCWAFAVGLGTV